MTVLRSLAFNAAFYVWTVVLILAALPAALGPRPALMRVVRFWASSSLRLLALVVGLRHEVRGTGRLPPPPFILAAKHQSYWDVLALVAQFPDAAFILKRELGMIPGFGWLLRRAGNIMVDRQGRGPALKGMLERARVALGEGRPIVVFPQGTRTLPGQRRPYHVGVAALYLELGVPVVPAALNSGTYWRRRRPVLRPGKIVLEFLPPLAPGLGRRAFQESLESAIEGAVQRLEAEAGAAIR